MDVLTDIYFIALPPAIAKSRASGDLGPVAESFFFRMVYGLGRKH